MHVSRKVRWSSYASIKVMDLRKYFKRKIHEESESNEEAKTSKPGSDMGMIGPRSSTSRPSTSSSGDSVSSATTSFGE